MIFHLNAGEDNDDIEAYETWLKLVMTWLCTEAAFYKALQDTIQGGLMILTLLIITF